MKTRRLALLSCACVLSAAVTVITADPPAALDKASEKWVQDTLKKMSLDEKVGQLIATSIDAVYTPTDSEAYEKKLRLVRDFHVGSVHVFGGSEPIPNALLNPSYGGASIGRKGDPYVAAAFLNQLQQAATIPLADDGRLRGRHRVHPERRHAAAARDGDWRDARPAAGVQGRQGGGERGHERSACSVDFYPVVDVNNNPRNPIINIRSFGEDVGPGDGDGQGLHEGHPGRGRPLHGEALPRPRRHRDATRTWACRRSRTRASASTRWSWPPTAR